MKLKLCGPISAPLSKLLRNVPVTDRLCPLRSLALSAKNWPKRSAPPSVAPIAPVSLNPSEGPRYPFAPAMILSVWTLPVVLSMLMLASVRSLGLVWSEHGADADGDAVEAGGEHARLTCAGGAFGA